MSESFMRGCVVSAILVGSLHAGETFRLMFDSPSAQPLEMFAATPVEAAAPSRS